MDPDSRWERGRKIVHVVGRLSGELIDLLGPVTRALALDGFEQCVVMIDALQHRQHVMHLHESAELLLVPAQRNPVAQWQAVRQLLRIILDAGAVRAVHLYGVGPGLVGACVGLMRGRRAVVFHTSQGSPSSGWLGSATSLVVRMSGRPLANNDLRWGATGAAELRERPVEDSFFAVSRHEARHPLIVTAGRAACARTVEQVTQLAILLGGGVPSISCNWIGPVDAVSHARLGAAGVGVFDVATGTETAARLAPGWIYLAPVRSPGFPQSLVEAMAAGLPCVALDCAEHRMVVRADETGYLCATERDMIGRIAALIDDSALRVRMGRAARVEAQRRFGGSAFVHKLRLAYAASN